MQVNTMCIIGAGTMGTGIAQLAAQASINVCLVDTSQEALSRSRRLLDRSIEGGVKREKLTSEQGDAIRALIRWDTTHESLAQADWIIEAVFEDRQEKDRVLRQACGVARDDAPVSSNTSTIPIKDLAASCTRPERFLGMHFFNPPPAMKLVEVIPGALTGPEVTSAALELCDRLGRTPLVAPDIPGFMVNRAFGALVSAAIDIWQKGAEPQAIDASLEMGLAHKMGPLKTADLVGLDIVLALLRSLSEQTDDPRFRVPEILVEMVQGGKLGRKSGEGFYTYED